MSINKRISHLRKSCGFVQQSFADKIGVSRQTISNIENGKHSASGEIIMNILKVIDDVNPRWLILGEGEMFEKKMDVVQDSLAVYESKYKDKLIESLERENELLRKEIERLKAKGGQ